MGINVLDVEYIFVSYYSGSQDGHHFTATNKESNFDTFVLRRCVIVR